MDFIDLLLLAAFVGFPLLQLLLEKLGVGKKDAPPAEEFPAEEPAPIARTKARLPPAQDAGNWSSGWGSWPTETLEDLAAEEVVSEEQADELIALREHFAEREIPEAVRVHLPVVSLESLHVDRKSEHARLHSRPNTVPVLSARPRSPAISAALRSPASLRQAFILSEVLGKPRSLREIGEDLS